MDSRFSFPDSNRRFRLTVAYDGRPWSGWQSQPGGDTIQDQLLAALQSVQEGVTSVHGSGRTDAGVHALAQVAHFDAPEGSRMDARAWLRAVNTKLPRTIRVMDCRETDSEFHARFSATGKTYRYEIFLGPVLPPLKAGLAWHVRRPLDFEAVHAAVQALQGRHDFASFAANRGDPDANPDDTHRTIFSTRWKREEDLLQLTFHGEGFLYKMVRLMVGAIIKRGQDEISAAEFRELLEKPGVRKSPLAVPADGLTLVAVDYEEELRSEE